MKKYNHITITEYSFKQICCLILFVLAWNVDCIYAQDKILNFTHLTVDDGLSQNTIHGIIKDKYGFMWFGTWEGVCRYDGYNFKIFRANENDSTALSNNRVNYLFKDSNEIIWISTGDMYINRYNYKTENFTKYTSNEIPSYIVKGLSRNGNYSRTHVSGKQFNWSIAYGGMELIQTNISSREQIRYSKDPFDNRSLSDQNLTDLFLDSTGIIWIGTENNGVNKADTRAKPFENYICTPGKTNSLIDNVVRAICEDKSGNIWVGTFNSGITKINPAKKIYTHYVSTQNSKNGLTGNQIRSLFCDSYGNVWIGTKSGLNRYDSKKNHFYQYSTSTKNSIPHNWVFWIMEDHCGYIWIGTFNGIAKYNKHNDTFLAYNPDSMLKSKNVRVILEDRNNNFWIGTEGGGITLLKRDSTAGFNEKLIPVKHYLHSSKDSQSLINNIVLTMAEDENGKIWVGTNNGLGYLDSDKYEFKRISANSDFPDKLIMGIVSDFKGHIWISHKKGLTRLNTKNLSIRTYTKSDGLQGNDFTQNAYFRSKNSGKLFFGGSNGMTVFYPDSIKDNPNFPGIVFTSIKILNQTIEINQVVNKHIILKESLLTTKTITLRYEDKSFSIEFSGLHFSNPQENSYKYKLEGFDDYWVKTDALNRTATYSNLKPNKYIFRVMAANSDGVWNPTEKRLEIIVLPPWWQTWWAYSIYLLIVCLLFFLVLNFIVARIKYRNNLAFERIKADKMHELDQMKLDFFTQVSHELRTPLSLIIDPLEKLRSGNVSPSKSEYYFSLMHRNATRLLRLINQLLDFRKSETSHLTLNLTKSDIVGFIKNIFDMFRQQAEQRKISLHFESITDYMVAQFDPDKLDKILFNLLSNAFKYTPDKGSIYISLTIIEKIPNIESQKYIQISVKDSGIGIGQEEIDKIFELYYQTRNTEVATNEGFGIGLALTKKLTELHGGEIKVESEQGNGSTFIVQIPHTPEIELSSQSKKGDVLRDPETKHANISNLVIENSNIKESDTGITLPQLLIIEDNTDVLEYITNEFSTYYEIFNASDGINGFKSATEIIPDIIISDIMMPVMNGIELCKKLKSDERTSHIPIILLTAHQSDEYKIEGYSTGADAYLTKPFSSAILAAQVKNLIESRQKLRTLFTNSLTPDIKAMALNITDEAFLNKTYELIRENLSDTNYNSDILASSLKMSKRQLYRKINALSNSTVHDFITNIRLDAAIKLLLTENLSISEVAYKVGYTEHSNFTRTFTNKFGKSPTLYIQELKNMH